MELLEKLKVSDGMGAWIDDFKKSDAPQFKGKDKKERRDMAIAAYLSAKRGDKNEMYGMSANKNDPSYEGPKKIPASIVKKLKSLNLKVDQDDDDDDDMKKEAVPYRKGHSSGDDAGDAPGRTVYNYKTKKVEFQPYKKMKKEENEEYKDAPFKGSYKKTTKPMSFKQARATVKRLAQKGMRKEASGHLKVGIDHMGGRDPVAKKHGVTITKAKGSNPYAHHATGPKAGLQKYLKHHYDGDHGEAKANHPEVYK